MFTLLFNDFDSVSFFCGPHWIMCEKCKLVMLFLSFSLSFGHESGEKNQAIDTEVYEFFSRLYFGLFLESGCYDYQFEIVHIHICMYPIFLLLFRWSGSSIKLIDSKFELHEPNCLCEKKLICFAYMNKWAMCEHDSCPKCSRTLFFYRYFATFFKKKSHTKYMFASYRFTIALMCCICIIWNNLKTL